jgi:hypothetical protein
MGTLTDMTYPHVDFNNFDTLNNESTILSQDRCWGSESTDSEGVGHHRTSRSPADRVQTAQTRQNVACVRCKMQRIRVGYFRVFKV